VAARYAIEIGGQPDLLAVSHLDQLAHADVRRIAVAYRYRGNGVLISRGDDPAIGQDGEIGRYVDIEDGLIVRLRPSPLPEDLAYQERLTRIVERCEPVYRAVPGTVDDFLTTVEAELGVPIRLASYGPTADDKRVLDSSTATSA
jgi:adenylosuccinate synthase